MARIKTTVDSTPKTGPVKKSVSTFKSSPTKQKNTQNNINLIKAEFLGNYNYVMFYFEAASNPIKEPYVNNLQLEIVNKGVFATNNNLLFSFNMCTEAGTAKQNNLGYPFRCFVQILDEPMTRKDVFDFASTKLVPVRIGFKQCSAP